MNKLDSRQLANAAPALFVTNDLALDFINTSYGLPHELEEVLVDDDAVMHWLADAKIVEPGTVKAPAGILTLALDLREEARDLLMTAKDHKPIAHAPIVNWLLENGRPVLSLDSTSEGPRLIESRRDDGAACLLYPIAAALGALLCEGDLEHVRECEAPDCTLIFHDKTKSRKRRWCSMSLCGNRMKVAAYRARKLH